MGTSSFVSSEPTFPGWTGVFPSGWAHSPHGNHLASDFWLLATDSGRKPVDAAREGSSRPRMAVIGRAADTRSVIEEGHPACGDVVHAAHERDRAVVEVLRHVRASLSDGPNRLAHVLLGHLRHAARVFRVAAVHRLDRGMDLGQQAGEVTELHAVDRALDCAAARVPEHHDELRANLDRVFEAPELISSSSSTDATSG